MNQTLSCDKIVTPMVLLGQIAVEGHLHSEREREVRCEGRAVLRWSTGFQGSRARGLFEEEKSECGRQGGIKKNKTWQRPRVLMAPVHTLVVHPLHCCVWLILYGSSLISIL